MNKWLLYILIAVLVYLLYVNVTGGQPNIQLGGTQKNVLDLEKISSLLDKFNI
jgi:hypothetical protein